MRRAGALTTLQTEGKSIRCPKAGHTAQEGRGRRGPSTGGGERVPFWNSKSKERVKSGRVASWTFQTMGARSEYVQRSDSFFGKWFCSWGGPRPLNNFHSRSTRWHLLHASVGKPTHCNSWCMERPFRRQMAFAALIWTRSIKMSLQAQWTSTPDSTAVL